MLLVTGETEHDMSATITVGSQHGPFTQARLLAAGAILAVAAGGTAIAIAAVDDNNTTPPPAVTVPASAESHSHPDLTQYRQQPTVDAQNDPLVSRYSSSEGHDGLRLYQGRR
jgi:hypothetical protein